MATGRLPLPDLTPVERASLVLAASHSPALPHARAISAVLWVDRGFPVARVARAFGLSRPTVYRYCRLWAEFRSAAALDPRVARRLRPWRAARPPARGEV